MVHGHGCGHGFTPQEQERRLGLAAALNVGIVALQGAAGVVAGSLGLLADAAHNAGDVAAVLLSLLAVRLLRRTPPRSRTFGYHRGGVLAAQVNAAALVAVGVLLGWVAVRRLLDPVPVEGGVVLAAALAGALVNGLAAWLVHDPAGDDVNMRSALLHLLSDALVSLAVAASGAVVLLTGGAFWLDPLLTLLVSLLVVGYALALLRRTTDVLLESAPRGLDVAAVERDLLAVPGVSGLHDLHVWSLSDRLLAASGHLEMPAGTSLPEVAGTVAQVKEVLRERYGVVHATLEAHPVPGEEGAAGC